MRIFLFLSLFFMVFSCQSQHSNQTEPTSTEEQDNPANVENPALVFSEEHLDESGDYSKLERLAPFFGSDMEFEDEAVAFELLKATDEFVTKYPNDRRSPIALFRAGGVARNLADWNKAQTLFEKAWKNYPGSYVAPLALFHNGYIYDQILGDKEEALIRYVIFTERYPDNVYAPEIAKLREMIELNQEELIEKLKERGQFEKY